MIFGKLKNLEKRIEKIENICEKIEKELNNNRPRVLSTKIQNQTEIQENWNTVVDEWLNGENKNKM